MADHQQRSRIVGKTSCQSHLGFQVKMVRRLVHDNQLGPVKNAHTQHELA